MYEIAAMSLILICETLIISAEDILFHSPASFEPAFLNNICLTKYTAKEMWEDRGSNGGVVDAGRG
jgi:hypothetical protein